MQQRVVTALVLIGLFLVLLFTAPTGVFAAALVLIAALAGWEWGRLVGLSGAATVAYAAVIGAINAWLFYLGIDHQQGVQFGSAVLGQITWLHLVWVVAAALCWMLMPVWLVLKPQLQPLTHPPGLAAALRLLSGLFFLSAGFWSAMYLRDGADQASPRLLLAAMAMVWAMDSGAYFVGRRFGRRKLAPKISPGKTVEGLLGGALAAFLLALAVLLIGDWSPGTARKFFPAAVLSALFSVGGDLYESRLKRAAGMKDSSQILPGHGGLLDRLDAVVAAMPIFVVVWTLV